IVSLQSTMNHVTKASPGRRERHKQQTRERLLDAAIECFLEKGYDETTVDQIAARADVARATVFNHFPEKERFLSAYLEHRRVTWSIGEHWYESCFATGSLRGSTQCSAFITRWPYSHASTKTAWRRRGRCCWLGGAAVAHRAKNPAPPASSPSWSLPVSGPGSSAPTPTRS